MAPDLNTVPPSPHGRHASTSMSGVHSSEPIAPSSNPMPPPSAHTFPREPSSASALGSNSSAAHNAGVGTGPGTTHHSMITQNTFLTLLGPLRHPRPLTAADLHMQLEKEQEAVVSYYDWEMHCRSVAACVEDTTSCAKYVDIPRIPSSATVTAQSIYQLVRLCTSGRRRRDRPSVVTSFAHRCRGCSLPGRHKPAIIAMLTSVLRSTVSLVNSRCYASKPLLSLRQPRQHLLALQIPPTIMRTI